MPSSSSFEGTSTKIWEPQAHHKVQLHAVYWRHLRYQLQNCEKPMILQPSPAQQAAIVRVSIDVARRTLQIPNPISGSIEDSLSCIAIAIIYDEDKRESGVNFLLEAASSTFSSGDFSVASLAIDLAITILTIKNNDASRVVLETFRPHIHSMVCGNEESTQGNHESAGAEIRHEMNFKKLKFLLEVADKLLSLSQTSTILISMLNDAGCHADSSVIVNDTDNEENHKHSDTPGNEEVAVTLGDFINFGLEVTEVHENNQEKSTIQEEKISEIIAIERELARNVVYQIMSRAGAAFPEEFAVNACSILARSAVTNPPICGLSPGLLAWELFNEFGDIDALPMIGNDLCAGLLRSACLPHYSKIIELALKCVSSTINVISARNRPKDLDSPSSHSKATSTSMGFDDGIDDNEQDSKINETEDEPFEVGKTPLGIIHDIILSLGIAAVRARCERNASDGVEYRAILKIDEEEIEKVGGNENINDEDSDDEISECSISEMTPQDEPNIADKLIHRKLLKAMTSHSHMRHAIVGAILAGCHDIMSDEDFQLDAVCCDTCPPCEMRDTVEFIVNILAKAFPSSLDHVIALLEKQVTKMLECTNDQGYAILVLQWLLGN